MAANKIARIIMACLHAIKVYIQHLGISLGVLCSEGYRFVPLPSCHYQFQFLEILQFFKKSKSLAMMLGATVLWLSRERNLWIGSLIRWAAAFYFWERWADQPLTTFERDIISSVDKRFMILEGVVPPEKTHIIP